ncbi:MAG: PhnA domain-containing protein [Planctomycetota bacterium]
MVPTAAAEPTGLVVKDENGTTLTDGDTVIVVKNLKVRGAASNHVP